MPYDMPPCCRQLFCIYVALVSEAYDQNRNEHTQYIWQPGRIDNEQNFDCFCLDIQLLSIMYKLY